MRYLPIVFMLCFLVQTEAPAPEPCVIHVESLEYPPLARQGRIQGDVKVSAWIDEQGNVTLPAASEGHPLLRDLVVRNLRTWKLRPSPQGSFRLDVTYSFALEGEETVQPGPTKVVFDLPHQVRITTQPLQSQPATSATNRAPN